MRYATLALSGLLFAIGLVLILETALVGGELGFLVGPLFIAAGLLRIYLGRAVRDG